MKLLQSVLSFPVLHVVWDLYYLSVGDAYRYNLVMFAIKTQVRNKDPRSNPVSAIIKDMAIVAGGLGFDSRAGLIERSVASGSNTVSPPPRRFFGAELVPQALSR